MLSAALVLVLAAAPDAGVARPKFQWKPLSLEVPGTIEKAVVPERQEALGIPIDLVTVRSRENLPNLVAHFRKTFEEAGLFVPYDDELAFGSPIPHVTGLDVVSRVSYSVLFQANRDGTITAVIGTAYLHARKGAAEPPITELPPGATRALTARIGESRSTSFRVAGSEEKVQAFFRESLKKRGLRETDPGHFEGNGQAYDVWIRPTPDDLAVVVLEVPPRAAEP